MHPVVYSPGNAVRLLLLGVVRERGAMSGRGWWRGYRQPDV